MSFPAFNLRSSCPEVFCKKAVLQNFSKFTGKHLCLSLPFNEVAGLRHRCFPVNFVKILRTTFFTDHLQWLLLNFEETFLKNKNNKKENNSQLAVFFCSVVSSFCSRHENYTQNNKVDPSIITRFRRLVVVLFLY